jgi:hypothetical protein
MDALDEYREKMPYCTWPERRESIETECPGALHSGMILGVGLNQCGLVYDGVSIRWSDSVGWVIPFAKLEQWYLENKAVRDVAGRKEVT